MAIRKRSTELVDMAKLMSFHGAEPLVLYQISGPGRPRMIRLFPLDETVLGRDDDCVVVLDEEPVSRHHAKIVFTDGKPELLDLGSTNGTFLNGKRVHRAFLKDGDQLQIGGSVFQAALSTEGPGRPTAGEENVRSVRSLMEKSKAESPAGQSCAFSGDLKELRLPSLLQVIHSDRSTGTLVVRTGGREGRIHVHQGAIRHAAFGRAQGVKGLYRLMVLADGRFEFFIPGRSPEYETVEGDVQKHLLEAMHQKDELELLRRQLPPGGAALAFGSDKNIHLARVPPAVFEVLAAVGRHRTVEAILEHCPLPDFEICRILIVLLKHEVLIAGKDARTAAS